MHTDVEFNWPSVETRSATAGIPPLPTALNVKQVANLLGVSVRHVYRLADGGLMPRPLKLGGLNRWHRPTIETWPDDS